MRAINTPTTKMTIRECFSLYGVGLNTKNKASCLYDTIICLDT